jgi:O-methyltransferase
MGSICIFLVVLEVRNLEEFEVIYEKYREFTMIPRDLFIGNLALCMLFKDVDGCVVECGVWKGGMIAAMAEIMGNYHDYFLYDSFEGLPEAQEIDGGAAISWQGDKESPFYFDNCKADMAYAERAMQMSGARNYKITKGWFSEALPHFSCDRGIAILRLDGDWYDSTMECLNDLYNKVNRGGIIIIDDYYVWDGCARAVHDFLSMTHRKARNEVPARIRQSEAGICYLVKT